MKKKRILKLRKKKEKKVMTKPLKRDASPNAATLKPGKAARPNSRKLSARKRDPSPLSMSKSLRRKAKTILLRPIPFKSLTTTHFSSTWINHTTVNCQ